MPSSKSVSKFFLFLCLDSSSSMLLLQQHCFRKFFCVNLLTAITNNDVQLDLNKVQPLYQTGCHVEAPEMVMLLPAAIGWSELPLHYDVSQCCAHHACNCLISFVALTQNTKSLHNRKAIAEPAHMAITFSHIQFICVGRHDVRLLANSCRFIASMSAWHLAG